MRAPADPNLSSPHAAPPFDGPWLLACPWLQPFSGWTSTFAHLDRWPSHEAMQGALEARRAARTPELPPLRVITQTPRCSRRRKPAQLDPSALYDVRIHVHGEIPTRPDEPHDFFNVGAFWAFPHAKRAMHARQHRALQGWLTDGDPRLPGRRTREQDALTLFDEGAVVLVAPPERLAALPRGASLAQEGFALVAYGHALLEHAWHRRPPVMAACLFAPCEGPPPDGDALLDHVDAAVARRAADLTAFQQPGCDAVADLYPDGRVSLRPSRAGAR
jgi:hypothetical protein